MVNKMKDQLVPYDMISPGWEAEYTGESDLSLFESSPLYTYSTDSEGNVMVRYTVWGFEHLKEEQWNDEIRYINAMQLKLGFLDGKLKEEFVAKYPHVKGFINRTYEWLESAEEFSKLQRLLMRRMLLPFAYFTKSKEDVYAISSDCFEEGGEGFKLDKQISELAQPKGTVVIDLHNVKCYIYKNNQRGRWILI